MTFAWNAEGYDRKCQFQETRGRPRRTLTGDLSCSFSPSCGGMKRQGSSRQRDSTESQCNATASTIYFWVLRFLESVFTGWLTVMWVFVVKIGRVFQVKSSRLVGWKLCRLACLIVWTFSYQCFVRTARDAWTGAWYDRECTRAEEYDSYVLMPILRRVDA